MTDRASFAARIRERYPEGLTGVIPIGGTRTTYILEHNRRSENPGQIESFSAYADHVEARIRNLMTGFFELGGQNLVAPILSYQLFEDERGPAYVEMATRQSFRLMNADWTAFYQAQDIDPYFAGIDTLLHFPERELQYRLGVEMTAYQQQWPYREERRKLIWEIAPIPLFSVWRAQAVMGEEAHAALEASLNAVADLDAMHETLYRYYAAAAYGTTIPRPHFYLGNNRSGELKLRAMLPISLLCGGPVRFFYVPYPTLLITPETLQAVLEDLAFGKRLRSSNADYSGKLTQELIEAEYQRVMRLSSDPETTLGLLRAASADDTG